MRLAAKTFTYAILHVCVATAVAYTLTGNLAVALGIGLIEPVVQTFVFALHEHLWERNRPITAASFRHHHRVSLRA